jgi:hypothetical protein
MDIFLKALAERLNTLTPRTQYAYSCGIVYFHCFGNGSWDNWQVWALNHEATEKYKEYLRNLGTAVVDLTGPAPMLRICAEVYLKLAG